MKGGQEMELIFLNEQSVAGIPVTEGGREGGGSLCIPLPVVKKSWLMERGGLLPA